MTVVRLILSGYSLFSWLLYRSIALSNPELLTVESGFCFVFFFLMIYTDIAFAMVSASASLTDSMFIALRQSSEFKSTV